MLRIAQAEPARERKTKRIATMALTNALFTGLSGLDVNQTRLNVIGNNIANVNTTAFKASRALIKPQFYVTDDAGSPASSDFGGENPSQRGLGAAVASIEKDFSPGAIEATGKNTDMAIDGDGFFVVQGKEQEYTRDGSFTLNENNQLVTTGGDFVQGFGVDANSNVIQGQLQNIQIPLGTLTKAQATTKASLQGNLDADGNLATGASDLVSDISLTDTGSGGVPTGTSLLDQLQDAGGNSPFVDGDVLTLNGTKGGRELTPLTLTVSPTTTVQDLQNFYDQGLGIDTGATTPPPAPTPGATVIPDPNDPTNTFGLFSIVGNTGTENALSLSGAGFSSTNPAMNLTFQDQGTPTGESVNTSFVTYDSLGTPLTINVTATLEQKTTTGTTWRFYATSPDNVGAGTFTPGAATPSPGSIVGDGTLTFDNDGKLVSTTNASVNIDRTGTGAKSPLNISLDFSGMTALTSTSSQLLMSSQDGLAIGTLTNFSVGANGIITGAFDNGLTSNLGQVAVATFDNPEGLVDNGGNMYSTGANSGVPKITAPLTLTAGAVRAGSLEESNVDLSKEFINMIVASTGFSAASRVITTSDQLITDLLNSGR
jgi:flagellar hook protein FlgE